MPSYFAPCRRFWGKKIKIKMRKTKREIERYGERGEGERRKTLY